MPTKRDQTVEAIFSQLELLRELASNVGEANLAQRLRALFECELATYCGASCTPRWRWMNCRAKEGVPKANQR